MTSGSQWLSGRAGKRAGLTLMAKKISIFDAKICIVGVKTIIFGPKIIIFESKPVFGRATASGVVPRVAPRNFVQDSTSFVEKGRIRAELWPFERART